MRLTWKKLKKRVAWDSEVYQLRVDGRSVGSVQRPKGGNWYWYVLVTTEGLTIPFGNSAMDGTYYDTLEEAKAACKAYVLKCLQK